MGSAARRCADAGTAARRCGVRDAMERPSGAAGCRDRLRRVRLVARRYGQSDLVTLPRPLSCLYDEVVEAMPAVLEAVGICRAVVVGYSDGASIALPHAGETRDRRLLGLVLIGPHVMVEDITVANVAKLREAYTTTDLRGRLVSCHRDVDNAFWGWNDTWLDPAFRFWSIDGSVRSVQAPMLLIQGAQDEYGTEEQLRAIEARAQCRTDTLLVPGAPHAVHETHLGTVLPAIVAFVASLRAEGGEAACSGALASGAADRKPVGGTRCVDPDDIRVPSFMSTLLARPGAPRACCLLGADHRPCGRRRSPLTATAVPLLRAQPMRAQPLGDRGG